jgi:hypothetical protein
VKPELKGECYGWNFSGGYFIPSDRFSGKARVGYWIPTLSLSGEGIGLCSGAIRLLAR